MFNSNYWYRFKIVNLNGVGFEINITGTTRLLNIVFKLVLGFVELLVLSLHSFMCVYIV